jgi:hypothetical protein
MRRLRLGSPLYIAAGALLSLGVFGCGGTEGEHTSEKESREELPGLRVNAPGAFQGYTLVAPYLSTSTFLLDMEGEVVHQWEADETPAGGAYLLEDGSLLRCADTENPRFRAHGTGGRVQLFDWEGELIWDYLISDDRRMQNHDFEPLPNGNVLIAAWEYRSHEEAIASGYDPEKADEEGLWPCVLVELEPSPPNDARIVWEWNAWDHLVQELDPSKSNYGEIAAHPHRLDINNRPHLDRMRSERDPESLAAMEGERGRLEEEMRSIGYVGDTAEGEQDDFDLGLGPDFLHVNGVSYEPDLDLIVLSCWETSEILVIDHSTTTEEAAGSTGGAHGRGGDILYRWGNPKNYGAGVEDDQQLFHQHDARWLPGPRLLVFNNEAGRADEGTPRSFGSGSSAVVELELPFEEGEGFSCQPGSPFGPAAPAWSHRSKTPGEFYGSFISGAHRLPNGNTFICEGPRGRLFEVTPDHQVVWEYVIPFEGMSVSDWWERFGWGDMDMESEGEGEMEDWDSMADDFMVSQAAFRATRIAPDHPGLRALDR